jgi:hypothetical protein
MRSQHCVFLWMGLSLCASGVARAQTTYKIQPILSLGDRVGDLTVYPKGDFVTSGLNDNGQIIFTTSLGSSNSFANYLLQYADGQFTPVASPGAPVPGGGMLARQGFARRPASMNTQGNIAFATDVDQARNPGTFFWDAKERTLSPVALKGMPAVNNLTFATGGTGCGPEINNRDEIAFSASVMNSANQAKPGVFLLDRDRRLQAVALPDQALPDGGQIDFACASSLNDAGVVAFQTRRQGESVARAYLWDRGNISPAVPSGATVLDRGGLNDIWRTFVNSTNGNILAAARTELQTGTTGLYLITDGKLKPVAMPGQEMPGGGLLEELQGDGPVAVGNTAIDFNAGGVSDANDRGQHAFLTVLQDGSEAAYLMDADGKVSLILKSGMATELGVVRSVGETHQTGIGGTASHGIGLNNRGQVAFTATIGDHPPTLVLLTPAGQ